MNTHRTSFVWEDHFPTVKSLPRHGDAPWTGPPWIPAKNVKYGAKNNCSYFIWYLLQLGEERRKKNTHHVNAHYHRKKNSFHFLSRISCIFYKEIYTYILFSSVKNMYQPACLSQYLWWSTFWRIILIFLNFFAPSILRIL